MLVPSLRAVGFRFQSDPALLDAAGAADAQLTLPVALGAGVLQISVLLDKGISMLLAAGRDGHGDLITHFNLLRPRHPLPDGRGRDRSG